jgi:hypothetical protein
MEEGLQIDCFLVAYRFGLVALRDEHCLRSQNILWVNPDVQVAKLPERQVSVGCNRQGWSFIGDTGNSLSLKQFKEFEQFPGKKTVVEGVCVETTLELIRNPLGNRFWTTRVQGAGQEG